MGFAILGIALKKFWKSILLSAPSKYDAQVVRKENFKAKDFRFL